LEPSEKTVISLAVAGSEAAELLKLSKGAFNSISLAVAGRVIAETRGSVGRITTITLGRNYRQGATGGQLSALGAGVVAAVSYQVSRAQIGQQMLGLGTVVHGTGREQRSHRPAKRVGEQVQLGAQPAAGAPKRKVCPVFFALRLRASGRES
jgi:hypothetical protein